MAWIKVRNRETGYVERFIEFNNSTCAEIDEVAGNVRCAIAINKSYIEVNYDNATG